MDERELTWSETQVLSRARRWVATELGSQAVWRVPELRGERWVAVLSEHVLFVAGSDAVKERMAVESRVAHALRRVLGPCIPRVERVDNENGIQLRTRVHGLHGIAIERELFGIERRLSPGERMLSDCPITPWGRRFAQAWGHTLALLHGALPIERGHALGLATESLDLQLLEQGISSLKDADDLQRAFRSVAHFAQQAKQDDCVVHGDPGVHNLFADARGQLTGLIDLGDTAIGNRFDDLRYAHSLGPRFVEHALDCYEQQAAVAIDRQALARTHVLFAFEHVATVPPEAPRHSRMREWARAALATLAPVWAP